MLETVKGLFDRDKAASEVPSPNPLDRAVPGQAFFQIKSRLVHESVAQALELDQAHDPIRYPAIRLEEGEV